MWEDESGSLVLVISLTALGTSFLWICLGCSLAFARTCPARVMTRGHNDEAEEEILEIEKVLQSLEGNVLVRLLVRARTGLLRAHVERLRGPYRLERSSSAQRLMQPSSDDALTSTWLKLGLGDIQYSSDQGEMPASVNTTVQEEMDEPSTPLRGGPRMGPDMLDLVNWIRKDFSDWDFDFARLRKACADVNMSPLLAITCAIHNSAESTSLSFQLGAPRGSLATYMVKVASQYRKLPYHSELHACDVLQAVSALHANICGPTAPPLEGAVLMLAAIVHDVGHPGVNNSFLVETKNPMALRYNDNSVLENFHVALAFSLMQTIDGAAASDPFAALDKPTFKRVRADLIDLVMATSFEHHFRHISELKATITSRSFGRGSTTAAAGSAEASAAKARKCLLRMLMKIADIGHPARRWDWHLDSARRACAEFFFQGKCEAQAGLTVSPLNNGPECQLARSQTGFVDFMVMPAFEVVSDYVTSHEDELAPGAAIWLESLLDNVRANLATWKTMDDDTSAKIKEEVLQIPVEEPFAANWFEAGSAPRAAPESPPANTASRGSPTRRFSLSTMLSRSPSSRHFPPGPGDDEAVMKGPSPSQGRGGRNSELNHS